MQIFMATFWYPPQTGSKPSILQLDWWTLVHPDTTQPLKREELLIHVTWWLWSEWCYMTEIRLRRLHIAEFHFLRHFGKRKSIKAENKSVDAKGWGRGKGVATKSYEGFWAVMLTVLHLDCWVILQLCICQPSQNCTCLRMSSTLCKSCLINLAFNKKSVTMQENIIFPL